MHHANAANLGVPRAFRDLLSGGNEPPVYSTTGQTTTEAARICQRPHDSTREILARLASRDRLLAVHSVRDIPSGKFEPSRPAGDVINVQNTPHKGMLLAGRIKCCYRIGVSLHEQGGMIRVTPVDNEVVSFSSPAFYQAY